MGVFDIVDRDALYEIIIGRKPSLIDAILAK